MKRAFTLAEVLITLGIIGVVAALVMPELIANYKEKQTVVRLKKVYSVLSNAYNLAKNENGGYDEWIDGKSVGHSASVAMFENMKPYLNISKDCGFNGGCFKNAGISTLDGRIGAWNYGIANTAWTTFILSDGTSVLFQGAASGVVAIDIDGVAGANTYGKDIFFFSITPDGVVARGMPDDGTISDLCNRTNTSLAQNGHQCTAWVIFNENMDYLHCDDLSWESKTKCN